MFMLLRSGQSQWVSAAGWLAPNDDSLLNDSVEGAGILADLTQLLVDHVTRGELFDLAPGEAIHEATMHTWGADHTIPAKTIRDILRRELTQNPDPQGLRVRGVRIAGRLNLDRLSTDVALELFDCFLTEGLTADDSHIPALVLEGCLIQHPDEPSLKARRIATSAFSLKGSTVISTAPSGSVVISGARISGLLDCDGAVLRNSNGPALNADNMSVDHHVQLRGMQARGGSPDGAVSLAAAQIKGSLNCAGAKIRNKKGPALRADGIQVDNHVLLRSGFMAHGSGPKGAAQLAAARVKGQLNGIGGKFRNNSGPALNADTIQVGHHILLSQRFEAYGRGSAGAVRLNAAHVGGSLNCDGAELRNDNGPALNADGAVFESSVWLRRRFKAHGNGGSGTVRLTGVKIGGQLGCDGALLRNKSGPALSAESVQVGQHVLLRDKFEAHGTGSEGTVTLFAAQIGGSLNCNGGKIYSDAGPALNAESIQVTQHVLFRKKFEAHGSTGYGTVRLAAARISGVLSFEGAKLHNIDGPALHAELAEVDQHVLLHGGFEAHGGGDGGAVRLTVARIGGMLSFAGSKLRNDDGPALRAAGSQVSQRVLMDRGFEAQGGGSHATLDMRDMKISGRLLFAPARLEHSNPSRLLTVEHLQYSGLPGEDWQAWLALLRAATPAYTAQPYQQLAAIHRALGHDREARMVLIAQRRDQLRRAVSSSSERAWGRFTGTTLGYGYQPWRALIALLAIVAIAVLLSVVGPGNHGGLAHTAKQTTGSSCSIVERIGVGLDFGLPLIKTGARNTCDVTGTTAGQTLTSIGWGLQAMAWGFATLFVAGFTGAVRKT
ncbi:hypothetical protein [Streptomyces sp. NPDC088760]|uniref:hypothetical protein n=1 Tax=Streptomyces sp. NPDC088760 TaxID=3365890 RepID=UPI0038041BBB